MSYSPQNWRQHYTELRKEKIKHKKINNPHCRSSLMLWQGLVHIQLSTLARFQLSHLAARAMLSASPGFRGDYWLCQVLHREPVRVASCSLCSSWNPEAWAMQRRHIQVVPHGSAHLAGPGELMQGFSFVCSLFCCVGGHWTFTILHAEPKRLQQATQLNTKALTVGKVCSLPNMSDGLSLAGSKLFFLKL